MYRPPRRCHLWFPQQVYNWSPIWMTIGRTMMRWHHHSNGEIYSRVHCHCSKDLGWLKGPADFLCEFPACTHIIIFRQCTEHFQNSEFCNPISSTIWCIVPMMYYWLLSRCPTIASRRRRWIDVASDTIIRWTIFTYGDMIYQILVSPNYFLQGEHLQRVCSLQHLLLGLRLSKGEQNLFFGNSWQTGCTSTKFAKKKFRSEMTPHPPTPFQSFFLLQKFMTKITVSNTKKIATIFFNWKWPPSPLEIFRKLIFSAEKRLP